MKLLGIYKNGNYKVAIFNDGTKVRKTEDDEFNADYPECIDYKITNYCDMNCPMCHEASSIKGKHGNIMNQKFIDTLMPYTELAIGGGNPLSHPDLEAFLEKLKERKIIANITVNQKHFEENYDYIKSLLDRDLIKGLGISLSLVTKPFVARVLDIPNAVIHVINGITPVGTLRKLHDYEYEIKKKQLNETKLDLLDYMKKDKKRGLKILILGYKTFRRGKDLYAAEEGKIEYEKSRLKSDLKYVVEWFKVVSFDNLAIKQLNVKSLMPEEEWNEFYMGDDGKFTMYIDGVTEQFAMCSVAEKRYSLKDDIKDMFKVVKEEKTVAEI